MKRFHGYFAASIIIVFCLHGLLFISYIYLDRRPNAISPDFKIKWNRAESIKESQILIIGGSNVRYNYSAEKISRQIDIPSVNLGANANLIIPYALMQWIPVVDQGDIILLPLEYMCYDDTKALNPDAVRYIKWTNPQWFIANPYKALEGMFLFGLVDLAKRYARNLFPHLNPAPSVNKFGDMKNPPHPEHQTPAILAKLEEKLETSPQPHSFSKYAREVLTKFITECHQRKATVVLTYPGTFYYKSYQETAFQDFIVEIGDFARDLGVPVIGTPEDFLFSDKGFFWDTEYHLNQRGRAIATERMIGLLKDFLKSTEIKLNK